MESLSKLPKTKSLNIIGCGKVGKTLGYLSNHTTHANLSINQVYNRDFARAADSIKFIGSGIATHQFLDLTTADMYMLSVTDDEIENISRTLSELNLIKKNDIVFHCSGLKTSAVLHHCNKVGAHTASIHPVMSFADPISAIKNFKGIYCGLEGDKYAVTQLSQLINALDANIFMVNPEFKALYHIGSVFISNYVVTLINIMLERYQHNNLSEAAAYSHIHKIMVSILANLYKNDITSFQKKIAKQPSQHYFSQLNHEVDILFANYLSDYFQDRNLILELPQASSSLDFNFANILLSMLDIGFRCFKQAGITEEDVTRIGYPLLEGVIKNVHHYGTTNALTGPIARGDIHTLSSHRNVLKMFDPQIYAINMLMGSHTLKLAKKKILQAELLVQMENIFS